MPLTISAPYVVMYSPSDGQWRVYRGDNQQASAVTDTKIEAVGRAKKLARKGGSPGVIVTDKSGDFQRFKEVSSGLHRQMMFAYEEHQLEAVDEHWERHR